MDFDRIATGAVVNLDTGVASDFNLLPFPFESTMTCFIRVTEIQVDELVEDFCEVVAVGTALDCYGMAFNIALVYQPDTEQKKADVLSGIQVNGYYAASGKFAYRDGGITLFDPNCRELSNVEVAELAQAFWVNEAVNG